MKNHKRNRRAELLERQGYRCWLCKVHIERNLNIAIDIHHIVHRSDGGTNALSNLAVVHKSCHIKHHKKHYKQEKVHGKGDQIVSRARKKLEKAKKRPIVFEDLHKYIGQDKKPTVIVILGNDSLSRQLSSTRGY